MRIFFIGDSIFEGAVGVNFIDILALKYPDWKIENAGVNGETVTLIIRRLLKKLEDGNKYDIIVLEAGANDILIPSFANRGYFFRKSLEHLISQGHNPISDAAVFEATFRTGLMAIKAKTSASLILSTLGCMNEKLDLGLNAQRATYNQIIRKIAREFNCGLADIAPRFDDILSQLSTRDYFLESFWNTAFLDKFRCSVLGQADKLSKKRNLHLTIDGGHLNSAGAAIFQQEIESEINKIVAKNQQEQNHDIPVAR